MTWTKYNDPVAYNAHIPYNGTDSGSGTTTTTTSNRHAARPWPVQRGRSHTFRRAAETPRPLSGVARVVIPKPEVTVSKTIEKIILAPERAEAEAKLVEFVKNRESRQEAQPKLPEPPIIKKPLIIAPKLPAETAGEQATVRHQHRQREDEEVAVLVGLLEGF